VLAGLAVMAGWPAFAQVPAGYPAEYGKIVEAAAKEGKLLIYSTTDATSAAPLLAEFRRLHPKITIEYSDLNSTELYNRIISETAANQASADMIWTGGMDTGVRLAMDGYAAEYASPEISSLPKWAVWKNLAYGTTFEPMVFMYNKRLLPADSVPQTHADLARLVKEKPELLRGKVTTYDPARGVGLMFNMYDVEYTPDFFGMIRLLGPADMKVYASSGSMLEKVASGEHLLSWNTIDSYVVLRQAKDPSIGMVVPKDYTLVISRVSIITKAAKNPNAARLFLDFLLSKTGQETLANRSKLYSLRDDVAGDLTVTALRKIAGDALKPIPVSDELVARVMEPAKRLAFLKQFQEAMNGQ
jgi:iron(III) transport system substrate-binding protein